MLLEVALTTGVGGIASPVHAEPMTTYERLLPQAVAGDPEVQNLIGFMFYHGEGVPRDLQSAHYWFHRAADAGNRVARRNLALLHSGKLAGVPPHFGNAAEARDWLVLAERAAVATEAEAVSRRPLPTPDDGGAGTWPSEGAYLYQTFCGGCHGFNGIAYYVHSPSFALGERMEKLDSVLMRSVANGVGAMPAWGAMMSKRQLAEVVAFVRTLRPAVQLGIGHSPWAVPRLFFRFKPFGEVEDFWLRFELNRLTDVE